MTVILVIDDELAVRSMLRVSLELNDYEVIEAVDAENGIEVLEERQPGVVILDIGLPGRSGLDALPHMQSLCPTSRFVLFTAAPSETLRAEALEQGAVAVVDKAAGVSRLLRELR